MFAMPGSRALSLNEHGVFVGGIPLLAPMPSAGATICLTVRPIKDLNEARTIVYRLPVDVGGKAAALALIAKALNHGDHTLAAVAAAQMRFPDPPPLGKGIETDEEIIRRAVELYRSGLLKGDWDSAEHPRTGTKPNPGWFAPKPKPSSVPNIKPRSGWPLPYVNAAARNAFEEAADLFAKTGRFLFWGLPVLDGIAAFMQAFSPTELNQGEDRLTAQLKAALQAPKTIEELQQEPAEDFLGYEQHHIVGQNDANLEKKAFEKFGSDLINDPGNIVWIPRLQHECVNAEYSSNSEGPGSPTVRDIVNEMDFAQQFQVGLSILRDCGALR